MSKFARNVSPAHHVECQMVTSDKSRQTSLRYPAKQHLGGGRGKGGVWTQHSSIFDISGPKLGTRRQSGCSFSEQLCKHFLLNPTPSAQFSFDLWQNLTLGNPLDRRGPPRASIRTKIQPCRPTPRPSADARQGRGIAAAGHDYSSSTVPSVSGAELRVAFFEAAARVSVTCASASQTLITSGSVCLRSSVRRNL